MQILGIETSCDETSAAVVKINSNNFKILSNVVSSQIKVHAKYGGIVPEVAARMHIENILPVIESSLKQAKVSWENIDYIAVCSGPGLISSLMVGVETAKTLAYAFDKPLVAINHLEGHLWSIQGRQGKQEKTRESKGKQRAKIKFPAVGLIVSGGHTQLVLIKGYLNYRLIGQTRDDAAGEAFDKIAKVLGLGYPGGKAVAAVASKAPNPKSQIPNKSQFLNSKFQIKLPRPMIDSKNFDLSFAGLKTAGLYAWRKLGENKKYVSALAREFQQAVVDVLIYKTLKAAEKYRAKTVILCGGVSANQELCLQMKAAIKKKFPEVEFLYPDLKLTGDNAAMIAMAGYYHIKAKDFSSKFSLKAEPDWELVNQLNQLTS